MNNKICVMAMLGLGLLATANASQNPGYVYSAYGEVLRDAYGNCVHTAYFNPAYGLAECNEAPPVEAPPPPPPVKPQKIIETITLSDADDVLFNFNAATLTNSGYEALNGLISKIGAESDVTKITINGYTDGIGMPEYNMKLSQERASAVKEFFVTKNIPADKIIATGYGMQDTPKSKQCFAQIGNDKQKQIWALQDKLRNKSIKAAQKKKLQQQLVKLQEVENQLISCTASDRRVVFTIEHTSQVEKTVIPAAIQDSVSKSSGMIDDGQ